MFSCDLVLRLGVEVARIVALAELLGRITIGAVDHTSAPDSGSRKNGVGPALHVPVVLHAQKFRSAIRPALRESAVPGEYRDVGDRVVVSGKVLALTQASVEHIELPLYLHGEAVYRVFDLGGRIGIEMAKTTTEVRCAAHLPEQPVQCLGA